MSDTRFTKYEEWLAADLDRGFEDASRHFENRSRVHLTLRKLAKHLDALRVPYAVGGDMAMFFHGFRRFTEILEVLTTFDGVRMVHQQCERLGCVTETDGSMDLRDAELGVRIHLLRSGQPPLPDMPLPVNYPDPIAASVQIDNLRVLSLPALIELKLAWGMKGLRHIRQLADVQELIDHLDLPRPFANQLNPLVQGKYWELWMDVQNDPCRGMY